MKKKFKNKNTPAAPRVEPGAKDTDIAFQISQIRQQLAFLEKKIDTLISQSSASQPAERPFERNNFSKPFQRFDRPRNFDRGRPDNNFRERSFTKAICADCNKECEVPFKPTGDRPVYCKECFAKRGGGASFRENKENNFKNRDFHQEKHFEKPKATEERWFDKKRKSSSRRKKERV